MAGPHIGTLRERPLHAALKQWSARPGDRLEVEVGGFVIDLVREDLLIEIQTRGFSSMKRKLTQLLERDHRVRIVHPIPLNTWIIKLDDGGTILDRRKSPKHGIPADLFGELVSFPQLLAHPGLEIEVVMTAEEQLRQRTEHRSWRRKGWSVVERRLIEVAESVVVAAPGDLLSLVPGELPQPFTTADLAEALGRPRRLAQQGAYCLRKAGAIEAVGKDGNAVLYELI